MCENSLEYIIAWGLGQRETPFSVAPFNQRERNLSLVELQRVYFHHFSTKGLMSISQVKVDLGWV